MVRRFLVPTLSLLVLLSTSTAGAETPVTYKHDQFPESAQMAAQQVSGMPMATQPGFVAGEAFGQVYHPGPGAYPVKIQGIDLIMAAPPAGGEGKAHAKIEIWFHDGTSADPGKASPDFVLDTHDVFDPITSQFGMPITGNAAMSFEFDWEDPDGHPPVLTEGAFTVMVRFTAPSEDLQAEWGSFQCTQMSDLGMCGCQQVGTINDQASTPQANLLHIIYPPGNCNGTANKWVYADEVGVTGDFILRARALAAQGVCNPDCTGKECGPDGCGGSCGDCAGGTVCMDGLCEEDICAPACDGKECGADGCGGVCGECAQGESCVQGTCQTGGCQTQCGGKECGDDGCGGVCGLCGENEECFEGMCEDIGCDPTCQDAECGDDGCGGSCGTCDEGETCQQGLCEPTGTSEDMSITDVSPDFGYEDAETDISVLGTGFANGATVKLGGKNLNDIQRVSDTLITATVPDGMTPGFYTVIVINPDNRTAMLPDGFEVQARPITVNSGGCSLGTARALPSILLLLALAAVAAVLRRRRA